LESALLLLVELFFERCVLFIDFLVGSGGGRQGQEVAFFGLSCIVGEVLEAGSRSFFSKGEKLALRSGLD
jgi:hypothetical protein